MTVNENQKWVPCLKPKIGDTLKWNEPLWAAPNKPRGKRDKIGEQEITATLISRGDAFEFTVIDVKKISDDDAPLKVQENDNIKRKTSTLELGSCHRLEEK